MAHHKKKNSNYVKKSIKDKLREKTKQRKLLFKEKRARLVVKNLPFKATEANLKEHFEKYGEVADVQLLKKPDGKLVGCGFIQFKAVQKAAKARHHLNEKPFLGRDIKVDFALPKNKYKHENKEDDKTKVEVKEEPEDKNDDVVEIKEEPSDDDQGEEHIKKNDDTDSDSEGNNEDDDDEEEAEDSESDVEDDEQSHTDEKPRQPYKSHDVAEGKTVFVKNMPFTATNGDLKECMLQFGPVYYALVCKDKFTDLSKGSGFVKFVNKEDADKALSAGTELTLLGNILDCHLALDRDKVNSDKDNNKHIKKDNRNLYLVKEGVILAGTKAAEGVSAADMAKRLQIEQYKTQMLRNLNMFVSRERIVIHNLPPAWDDTKLRQLVENYGGEGAQVKEARVMRNMKQIEANGLGKSKEYGFVTFTNHENALHCLRALNNNPNIFTPQKRPIIAFSIENKNIAKIKQKRLEKSKQKNPLGKEYKKEATETKTKSKKRKHEPENDAVDPKYLGTKAKPGVAVKMRNRFNLKTQAKLHHENLKNEKRRNKMKKLTLAEKRKQFIKEPKQKMNQKVVDDNLSRLVRDYKNKIMSAQSVKKIKWYEKE